MFRLCSPPLGPLLTLNAGNFSPSFSIPKDILLLCQCSRNVEAALPTSGRDGEVGWCISIPLHPLAVPHPFPSVALSIWRSPRNPAAGDADATASRTTTGTPNYTKKSRIAVARWSVRGWRGGEYGLAAAAWKPTENFIRREGNSARARNYFPPASSVIKRRVASRERLPNC